MKKAGLFVLVFFALSFVLSFASAAYYPTYSSVGYIGQSVVNAYTNLFEPILGALFGGFGGSGFYVFERFLLFVVLVSVIYLILGKTPLFAEGSKATRWVVAIIVPLIGVRFINYTWLAAVLDQYQALAVILTAILPFVIFFYFLYNVAGDHGIIRKMGWLVYVGIYLGLWANASSDSSSQIYFWTFVIALVCLFGDEIIKRRYDVIQAKRNNPAFINNQITSINDRINTLNQSLANNTAHDPRVTRQQIRDLEAHKKWLLKQ